MARPRRKAANSQEIRAMLEVSDEEEADLSGLSDDSTLDATFKPAGRDGRISSSASDEEVASTGQFWKIKWYVGYFIKYFLGSYNFFQYVFFMIL